MDSRLMMRLFHEDEDFRAALLERARRERAETFHRLLVLPLLGLFRLPLRAARRAESAPDHRLYCG